MITINKILLATTFNININVRYISLKTNIPKVSIIQPPTVSFLVRVLGLSTNKCTEILKNHSELLKLNQKDITNTVETLKTLKYDISEVEKKPMILYVNSLTLENRYVVLGECGVNSVTLPVLSKYVTIMNKEITLLKSHGLIPFDTNVQEKLENCFANDIEIKLDEKINENIPLKKLRELIISSYLTYKLQMNQTDLDKQWKVYSRIRHKSFQSIMQMINLLINELNFSKERIVKNGFLIYGDPDNVKRMLKEIHKIGNDDFKEILYRRPKILMSTCESIIQTIENVKAFNIPEVAITKCLEVLTLGSDTVLERLTDLKQIEEFDVLATNPRILRLVHYQNKARIRLDYLSQLKVRCASLHILSCGSEAFVKFARDGTDRTKGRDVVVYLSNIFNKSEADIRELIARHPNWCHIPVIQVKQCLDALIEKKFKHDDIFYNLHILLYPLKRIEEKLNILKEPEIYKEMGININYLNILNTELLNLCLYLIEEEFHFTGDGIWTEHHTQQAENFNNLLPDFSDKFQKIYKYGTKPATQQNVINLNV